MSATFRIAVVWGFICFLLLYRTLLSEVILSWQVLQQYDIPVWQLFVSYASNILPALIPLGCFVWLTHKATFSKMSALTLPLAGWLIGRFVVIVLLWIITVKISNPPPYTEGLHNIIIDHLIQVYGSVNTLTSALVIMVCAYAFWRERITL